MLQNNSNASTSDTKPKSKPIKQEHSVPFFWPMAAAIEFQEAGLKFVEDNIRYLAEAEAIEIPPPPDWATTNSVRLDLDTMQLRDFSKDTATTTIPVLVDAPYAGHSSTIADYAPGQSLVQTLLASGIARLLPRTLRAPGVSGGTILPSSVTPTVMAVQPRESIDCSVLSPIM